MIIEPQPLDIRGEDLYSSHSYEYPMDVQTNLFSYSNQSEHSSSDSTVRPLIVGAKKYCKCGCGEEIIIKKHHKYKGIPQYIQSHNFKKNAKKSIYCLNCSNMFYYYQSSPRKYCSDKCYHAIPKSEESNQKRRVKILGIKRSKETIEKQKLASKLRIERDGYINSPETIEKIRLSKLGKLNPKCSKTKKLLFMDSQYKQNYLNKNSGCFKKGQFSFISGKTYEEFYGIKKAMEIKEKLKNRIMSEEWRLKISKARINLDSKKSYICKYCSKEFVDYVLFNRVYCSSKCNCNSRRIQLMKSQKRTFTKPEMMFMELINKNNLPYKYTGDGSFWIENLNPDFVDCNGKKVIIEIFSDYWHNPLLRTGLKWTRTEIGRIETLKKYGWKCIILWEKDIRKGEKFILNKIKNGT